MEPPFMPFLSDLIPPEECVFRTETNMNLLFVENALSVLEEGDVLYTLDKDGVCCGSVTYEGGNFSIAIWGDDSMTPNKWGLLHGEAYFLVLSSPRYPIPRLLRVTAGRDFIGQFRLPLTYTANSAIIITDMEPVETNGQLGFTAANLSSIDGTFIVRVRAQHQYGENVEALLLTIQPENVEIVEVTGPSGTVQYSLVDETLRIVGYQLGIQPNEETDVFEIKGRIGPDAASASLIITGAEGAVDDETVSPANFELAISQVDVQRVLLGDVNGDGTVSLGDALLVVEHLLFLNRLEGNRLVRADVDQDQSVTIRDLWRIVKQSLGL